MMHTLKILKLIFKSEWFTRTRFVFLSINMDATYKLRIDHAHAHIFKFIYIFVGVECFEVYKRRCVILKELQIFFIK